MSEAGSVASSTCCNHIFVCEFWPHLLDCCEKRPLKYLRLVEGGRAHESQNYMGYLRHERALGNNIMLFRCIVE
jgi:hypothetical protein